VPFTDARFTDAEGRRLEVEPDEWGLAARFVDLDGDGHLDLYVCNDINSPDHIWMNDGQGGFRLAPPLAFRKTSTASMAVDAADVDRDGRIDLFVAEMLSPSLFQRRTQVPEVNPEPDRPGEIERRPQVKRNTLQMGREGGFAETAFQAGIAASGWTWGVLFMDVDLDGYEDLLLTNGNVVDWLDGDAQDRTRGGTGGTDWRALRLQFPPLEQRNVAFRNNGDGKFSDMSDAWGIGSEADISNGLAAGDLDADGDLDVVINRLDAPPRLLRNESTAPRLAVRLAGLAPNTGAIGSVVRLIRETGPEQQVEIAEGGLYLSDSDGLASFAASPDGRMVLEVDWPSGGGCTRIQEVLAGREYEVAQPQSPEFGCSSADDSEIGVPEAPVLEDATALLGHTHFEEIFVDEFTRQPLVALRLAQLGPGVSWIDPDGDGYPDLWVGTGKGGRVMRFTNDNGELRPGPVGDAAAGDISTILAAPPGIPGLALAGQMNYETANPQQGIGLPSVLSIGAGSSVPAIDGTVSTTGPLAMADVNGDGVLDLFVGGRAIPTAYPVPASSRLFLGGAGKLNVDELGSDGLAGLGLVSGAVFSDVDLDGDPDLLVALEWGPVTLLLNEAGRLVDATDAWGLSGMTGRWNGIATGDLDGDGRPDVVVTGWGSNTEAELDETGRSALYGDFDRNGILDIVELARDSTGAEVPALRLGQLARGLPYLRRVTPDNRTFAAADLETLLGPGLPDAERVEAAELRHMALLNRGGSFEPMPLPNEAQRAPAFGVAIADFDADGREDVFLAQNFFATRLDVPRYDAGSGLILSGDGAGGFGVHERALGHGDGRGLAVADFDADGRVDVALGQNGGPTRLWRNVSPVYGLRVRLEGSAMNPSAIGASVRVEYAAGLGPAREIQAGSGYWSSNSPTVVLGLADIPVALRVRWPDGEETRAIVAEPDRNASLPYNSVKWEVTATAPEAGR
ncbi:MAG: CRTAC1 family protein, partial [Gemmatimonadota bacterium]|nr:CRTAC1 family protein [Gemmatimonadota bacterium]